MFKFLKSKKGFTLVELMIVVVIMAILVAVAVPIYSAVTANSRRKTCQGNQRNIITQISNSAMGDPDFYASIKPTDMAAGGTITIVTNDTGDAIDTITPAGLPGTFDEDAFRALFQKQPFCPEEGNTITVTITGDADMPGQLIVETACTGDDHTLAE